MFKMSDWEDEYNEDGVAIQKPVTNSAPAQCKLPCNDRQNVFFGMKHGASREVRADRSGEGSEYQTWRGGGGRPFTRSTGRGAPGRWGFNDEKVSSSPPVTITVENSYIGRVIGRFLM